RTSTCTTSGHTQTWIPNKKTGQVHRPGLLNFLVLSMEPLVPCHSLPVTNPLSPDRDQQSHQDRADEQAHDAHCLHTANQTKESRQERQFYRATHQAWSQCFVDNEQLDSAPQEQAHASHQVTRAY